MEKNAMVASESVVCPKPRRSKDYFLSRRWYLNNHSEMNDLKARAELLDIISSKGSGRERSANQVASSPPFFCGSPPSRVPNPIVHDEQFGSQHLKQYSPVLSSSASPSSLSRKGGCVRAALAQNSAAVRIEGFDCLSRDRQNCSISAVA